MATTSEIKQCRCTYRQRTYKIYADNKNDKQKKNTLFGTNNKMFILL